MFILYGRSWRFILIGMLNSEHIRDRAPLGAAKYRLVTRMSDGTSRIYPSAEGAFFPLGEAPEQVPAGRYAICYYDISNSLIRYTGEELDLQLPVDGPLSRPTNTGQAQMRFLNATGGAVALPGKTSRPPLPAMRAIAAVTRPATDEPTLSESELELRRHMQAMDVEERQQEFIKSSTYVTELGETFALNRILRRELMEMGRMVVEASRRAFQDVEQVKGTVHDLLALQKLVLEHAATNLARPAPPPPDFVGLGHSALSVVKELGVALLARSHRAEAAALPSVATTAKAALPAGAHAMDAEISKTAAPKREEGARDGVSRIVQKLSGMSEADLATAMASVEGFRALLDSLRGGDVPTSDGARKESEANTEKVPHATSTAQAASVVEAGAAKS